MTRWTRWAVGIEREKVNWVLGAGIADFFTSLDHGWVGTFLERRIAGERVLRLVGKWLSAGVMEDGVWAASDQAAPQGGLCEASHNDPYGQRWVMRSARGLPLVGAVAAVGRCA